MKKYLFLLIMTIGICLSSMAAGGIFITKPIAQKYVACQGTDVKLEVSTKYNNSNYTNNMTYYWYKNQTGGQPVKKKSKSYVVKKDQQDVQVFWVQAYYNNQAKGERVKVTLEKSPICGEEEPVDCSVSGSLMFREDFGGNNEFGMDPLFSQTPFEGHTYTYNGTGLSSNAGLPYIREKEYFITKIGEPHHTGSVNSNTPNQSLTTGEWKCIDDHTYPGDPDKGYFMEANADFDPGQFFRYEISSLCAGAPMLFTAWIANVLSVNSTLRDHVNQIFILETKDGEALVHYYTGNILNGVDNKWRQYGFEFVVPDDETDLILKIINNGTGSQGNDFGIDDIEVYYCANKRIEYPNAHLFENMFCEETPIIAKYYTDEENTPLYYKWLYSLSGIVNDEEEWEVVKSGGPYQSIDELTYEPTKNGYYRCAIGNSPDFLDDKCHAIGDPLRYYFTPNPEPMYWSKTPEDFFWNNPNNWEYEDGTPYNAFPTECSDVHIPGKSREFPWLDEEEESVCRDIYFHFGGEIAQVQALTYRRAQVQYNFGTVFTEDGENKDPEVGDENDDYITDNDEEHSSFSLKRNQWYALAAPLKGMVSGDFSVGGFPNFWQRSFSSSPKEEGFFEGDWALPNSSVVWRIDEQHNAIAIQAARLEDDQLGFDNHDYLEELEGVLYMPFFHENDNSYRNRIYTYDPVTQENTFYYYYYDEVGLPIEPTAYETIIRGEECFRFIFEDENNEPLDCYTITVPAGQYVMVGNPFLSSLSFAMFYTDNEEVLADDIYRIAQENDFIYYEISTGSPDGLDPYVAPLQAFHVLTAGEEGDPDVELKFTYDQSIRRSYDDDHGLRAPSVPANNPVIYLKVENEKKHSYLSLAFHDDNEQNSKLLKMKSSKAPIIYATDALNNKNIIQHESLTTQREVPIGILYNKNEALTISLEGTGVSNAKSVRLIDKQLGKEIDLLEQGSYSFQNTSTIQERFSLIYSGEATSLEKISDDLYINLIDRELTVRSGANDPIKKVELFDVRGRKLFSSENVNQNYFKQIVPISDIYVVVKVTTEKNQTTRKFLK